MHISGRMNKLLTYTRYFYDYFTHGELWAIVASARYLFFRTSHNTDRTIHTRTGKFFCRKNTNDFQFANYYYEWEVRKFMLSQSRRPEVFIDCGACIGAYSVLMAKQGARCYAFEPVKENFEAMVNNIKLNNLENKIIAYNFGLGAESGKASFVFNPVNTGASHVTDNLHESDFHIDIRTFDSMVPELGIRETDHVILKLDVEGMETQVLRGAYQFIRNHPNLTIVAEDKFSSQEAIREILYEMAKFRYGKVDENNIFARKAEVASNSIIE
jgi:FkbM family methyltransferase